MIDYIKKAEAMDFIVSITNSTNSKLTLTAPIGKNHISVWYLDTLNELIAFVDGARHQGERVMKRVLKAYEDAQPTPEELETLFWERYKAETEKAAQEIEDARELIQDDLLTCLEGMSDKIKTDVCEIVVQRFKPLLDKQPALVQIEGAQKKEMVTNES